MKMTSLTLHVTTLCLVILCCESILTSPIRNVSEPMPCVDDELLLIQAIFRHGDRTPISLYKTDPYNNYTWTDGLGQLIQRGKARMYHYGQTLRKRYATYLDDILLTNIRAQSSPSRRVLETTLSVLAGTFPPKSSQAWANNPLAHEWQPIAVETTEKVRAWLLNSDTPCPAAQDIEQKLPKNDPILKKALEDNADFIDRVKKATGQTFESWIQMNWVYDAIFSEKNFFGNKFVMPAWLNQVSNDTYDRLKMFESLQFSLYRSYPTYLRLRQGLLMNQIINNFKEAAALETISAKTKKIFLYGSHDTFINMVTLTLGYDLGQPTYGSGLIFELRRNSQTKIPMVQVFYVNTTNNDDLDNFNVKFRPLSLNNSLRFKEHCANSTCSLDNFAISLKDYVIDSYDNMEKECELKSSQK